MEQQPVHIKSSGTSPEKTESEKQIVELEIQNSQLMTENFLQSLTEDKIYRAEKLQALMRINQSIENLTETISEALSTTSEGTEEKSTEKSEETSKE